MKQIYHILAVVLFVTGALLTSCNKVETTPEDNPELTSEAQTIQFTATLAAKGEDPGTKTISTGTDTNGKEILNVAWAVGEEIGVWYHKYINNTLSIANTTAIVTAVDPTTGTATISATLTNPKDGGRVQFVYPATLTNAADDIAESILLNQHGNLTGANGISTLYDAATGSGTLSIAAGTAVVNDMINMTNEVCICKFHFSLDNGSGMGGGVQQSFNNIKIYDGNGHVYTITSDRPHEYTSGTRNFTNTDDIYVAMLPVSGKTVIFHYEQTVSGGKANYIKFAPNTTLEAGKFYRSINITLTKDEYNGVHAFKDLSKGSITATDGDIIYQSNSTATDNTITIPDGATVTLAGVNIEATASAGIICNGSANIKLVGTNSVTSTANHYPAIQAGGSGTTLTISGSGSLTTTGCSDAAGIGSGQYGTCGNITISGGTIAANGGNNGAAIGTGFDGTCGNILISGGSIDARGKGSGASAGIGCGAGGTCGTITITTGVTRVYASGTWQYCIGKGSNSINKTSTCGTITIGGTVMSQEDLWSYDYTYQP